MKWSGCNHVADESVGTKVTEQLFLQRMVRNFF